MIEALLQKYNFKTKPGTLKPKPEDFVENVVELSMEGADIFTELYQALLNSNWNKIHRTAKGYVSHSRATVLPAYDINIKRSLEGTFTGAEITIFSNVLCRIVFCGKPKNVVGGRQAFREFKAIFKRFGIDINKYAVPTEKGLEYKKQIESPLIELEQRAYQNLTFENAHHLDWNSSYSTGLINLHPEFKEPLEYMYKHRHVARNGFQDYYKGVMNSSIGWMQSEYDNYNHAMLSRDAVNDNNKRIRELADKLRKSGRIVLLYNTDGIWYQGDIYHDEDEGKDLGQWKNDHINCKFRAKSDGAYEYIEDGQYYPVVRGATRLDKIKPRTEWEWGDIFRYEAKLILFRFEEGEGIKYE